MKKIIYIISIALVAIFLTSCEYDNYDAPEVKVSGKLTYKGESFLYDGSPARGLLKVVQKGFGKVDGGTTLRVDEKGNFTQLLFPGDYWLTLHNAPYPFEIEGFNSLGAGLGYDSIHINLKSDFQKSFEVTPYYNLTNLTVSVVNKNIVLKCDVTKNEGTLQAAPRVIFARGYVSTTPIVNGGTLCTKMKRAIITDNGSIEVTIPISGENSYRSYYKNNFKNFGYCRLAIELDGIPTYYLFSESKRLDGIPLE